MAVPGCRSSPSWGGQGLFFLKCLRNCFLRSTKKPTKQKTNPTKLYESTGKPVKISSNKLISVEVGLLLCRLPTVYETGWVPASRVQHAASFHPPAAGNNF